ncbi:NAD-dependent epimerase/dehydratase family protein [Legionella fallonii]|uniref:Nucleoside-diphosphate-sugar epimerase n=1 Tax=Legionella fallonii LLAP-10 TaxID=1212491 RepID=A0A098FZH4_9GAMM|nr:SDR family NAD(P)-dependent oxidoreductase [Legionella fallonii]CEG55622.1 Nucleoside-diphosphate-sugar epimerase [Legionella fallonii LLAP-10]
MRCVVTGATGCLGLNLTQRLVQEGHEVMALGRNQHLGALLSQFGAQFVALDLNEKTRLQQLMQNAELIFHCAALSSPWGPYKDFYHANVVGTQHVIAATPSTARLIHVSSPSVYFDFTEKHQIKEEDVLPSKPVNHYIKTKRLAESLIDQAHQEQRIQVITIRPRALFGPYDRAIFPRLLKAERNGVLPLIGSGENIIDITFVDNVVESLILAAQAKNQFLGKKYNITNDEPQKLTSLITELYRALGKPLKVKYIPYSIAKNIAHCLEILYRLPFITQEPRLTAYSAGVLALGQTLNIEAAKTDLGYKPIVSVAEGMQRFAHWYHVS